MSAQVACNSQSSGATRWKNGVYIMMTQKAFVFRVQIDCIAKSDVRVYLRVNE